jgi:hypothetical protein
VASTALAYRPALPAGFLLDDWPNLAGLAGVQGGDPAQFWRYLVETATGPTGRPLAMLSFALQADAWPADPAAFRAVNLALHLACGVALALLGRAVARTWWPARPATADWIAVAAAGLWLLHPLNVSTAAYVVQRMAQLATLFTLLALLAWTHGRLRLARAPDDRRALAVAATGLVAGGAAAVLSKETGVLLLAYALVLEHWAFAGVAAPVAWRRLRAGLLVAPALLFIALCAWRFDALAGRALEVRDFTLLERLLSQPRALLDYLGLILAPRPDRLGLFHDDFVASRGLLEPATTLPALLLVLLAAALAFAWRRRAAPLAFASAWFLGGHLLESTVLPLELYFEHRNYLPMAGPLLAAAHYAAVGIDRLADPGHRRLALGAALAVLLGFGALTWAQARLWSQPLRLVATWAAAHPGSARAQGTLLGLLKETGEHALVVEGYRAATARFPDDASLWLGWTELDCITSPVERPALPTVADALAAARPDYSAIVVLTRLVTAFERDGRCGALPPLEVAVHLGALLANPRFAPFEATLRLLRARLAVVVGDDAGAGADFDRAFALEPGLDVALQRFYGALRGDDAARVRATFVDARSAVARDRWRGRFHAAELEEWRRRLRAAGVTVD